jgi:hypothetical protein
VITVNVHLVQYESLYSGDTSVPDFIDPVFAKTSPKRSFSMTENKHFGPVFAKTGSINSGNGDSKIFL